jgi:hypothetical protein
MIMRVRRAAADPLQARIETQSPVRGDWKTVLSLSAPLGRFVFAAGVGVANTALFVMALASFAFLPSGEGHIAVLVIMGALMMWWFSLHARRFADAGWGVGWPAAVAVMAYGTFAVSYLIVAALWSVPEVQQEAFRTGGGDYRQHRETFEALTTLGRWLAGGIGAAWAVVLTGFLAVVMGLVSIGAGVFSLVALMLPSGARPMSRPVREAR